MRRSVEFDCDTDDEAGAAAALDEEVAKLLKQVSTEQLVEALKGRGYTKVILEDG